MGLLQVNIQSILDQIVEKLKKEFDPIKIVLFGSNVEITVSFLSIIDFLLKKLDFKKN